MPPKYFERPADLTKSTAITVANISRKRILQTQKALNVREKVYRGPKGPVYEALDDNLNSDTEEGSNCLKELQNINTQLNDTENLTKDTFCKLDCILDKMLKSK